MPPRRIVYEGRAHEHHYKRGPARSVDYEERGRRDRTPTRIRSSSSHRNSTPTKTRSSPSRSQSASKSRGPAQTNEGYPERGRRTRTPAGVHSSSSSRSRSASNRRESTSKQQDYHRDRTPTGNRSRSSGSRSKASRPRRRSRSNSRARQSSASLAAAFVSATEEALDEFFKSPKSATQAAIEEFFSNPKATPPPKDKDVEEETPVKSNEAFENKNEILQSDDKKKELDTLKNEIESDDKKRTISHDTNVGPAEIFVHTPSNLEWVKNSERNKMGLQDDEDKTLTSAQLTRSSTSLQDMMMTYVSTWCSGKATSRAPKAIEPRERPLETPDDASTDSSSGDEDGDAEEDDVTLVTVVEHDADGMVSLTEDVVSVGDGETQLWAVEHDAEGVIVISGEQEQALSHRPKLLMKQDLAADKGVDTRMRDIEAVLSVDEEDEPQTTNAEPLPSEEKSVASDRKKKKWRMRKKKTGSESPGGQTSNAVEEKTHRKTSSFGKAPSEPADKTEKKRHKRSASLGLPRPTRRDHEAIKKTSSLGLPQKNQKTNRRSLTPKRGHVIRSTSLEPGRAKPWTSQRPESRGRSSTRSIGENSTNDNTRRTWIFGGRKQRDKEGEQEESNGANQSNGANSSMYTDETYTYSASSQRDEDSDGDEEDTVSSDEEEEEYKNENDYNKMKRTSEDLVEPIFQAALDAAKMLEEKLMETGSVESAKSRNSDLSAPKHPGQVFAFTTSNLGF